MHRYSILIIDDDEDDYLIVKSLLEDLSQAPLQLEWASSYAQGEELLAKNAHSICLMDYQLGAKNGIELLKHSQELGFTGPIILLTGMHQSEVDILALEAGAVDYLVKNNLTAEQLARSIRYALGRREMDQERIDRLRAEAENRSKSEFLAHLSHELRTPLSAILGFTELLINNDQNPENLAHLNVVHRNGKHLLGLLNDILDLSKIEAGKLDLEIQPLHFISFIADVYSLMRTTATDKNLTLNITARNKLPEIIHTDPTRLRQVLLNLIGNAIKFTFKGSVDIEIDVDTSNNVIVFKVTDSGIGISSQHIKAIFKPFVQVKNSRAQTRTGSGLGLTISRQLAEHLGGTIRVTSKEGVGSCFEFSIDPGDISKTEFYELSLNLCSEPMDEQSLPQFEGNILVVDDLRDIRALIGHYVKRCGLTVDYASNGLEAINKLEAATQKAQYFDLILMDIHMPVKDGISTALEIRQLGYTCPLVALTAAHMKGDVEVYLNAGFNCSLSKPVDQMQIVNVLKQYLEPSIVNAIPAYKESAPEVIASSPSTPKLLQDDTNSEQKPEILVVEDAPDALEALENIFALLGWQALPANDAESALNIARTHSPRYAMLDLNLPDMNGYELSEKLAQQLPDIQIFIASGAELESKHTCAAIKGHLLKPVSIDQLQQLIKSL